MAKLQLPRDFSAFLKLLNANSVEYLVIGAYAVGAHGYVRATNDLDIRVKMSPENAGRVDRTLRDFGFGVAGLNPSLFLEPKTMIRMGVPPLRLEILTSVSALEFDPCYAERVMVAIEDDLQIPLISLARLRQNKAATGRSKDPADLDNLPK